ncbi:MAG TPA: hypothetical protein VFJ02_16735, partial [Vicinamibacterales bacterium]|nr:hypothetical protein [Vicinamibacterales bacterium]
RHPDRARPPVRARVFEAAGEVIQSTNRRDVVPLRRPTWAFLISVLIAAAAVAVISQRTGVGTGSSRDDVARSGADAGHGLVVVASILPPAYTREPLRTLENPDRIDAIAGSRLRLVLRSRDAWRVRLGHDEVRLQRVEGGAAGEVSLAESGYLAFERRESGQDDRRLVPVAVTPDRAPAIRIDAPAKDLLLPDAKATVPVTATATDDFALESLDLRYTRVSGSGEQFEFKEGSIPLQISRPSDRSWSARTRLALGALALAPGDSLIYRVVGKDRRPGDAGFASSETYFIEVAGPGQVALEGFELPPDRERYALSQQMIVLKLERLRARERSLARRALEEEVANIAAEQRAVRSNFIFLTGGTVEDEEEEAAHEHEIQEGRLENTARREIANAIQHMGRVEQGLAAVNTAAALPAAKAAVDALQRAFGRNRYFLRTLPSRSRVDPARRLTGELATASNWRRELFPIQTDEPAAAARMLLARLLELSPQIRSGSLPSAATTALAEQAIAVAPSSVEWQRISKGLVALGDTPPGDSTGRATLLSEIVAGVVPLTRGQRLGSVGAPDEERSLRSAWEGGSRR